MLKIRVKVLVDSMTPESNGVAPTGSNMLLASPTKVGSAVTVCRPLESFVNRIESPTFTVISVGENVKSRWMCTSWVEAKSVCAPHTPSSSTVLAVVPNVAMVVACLSYYMILLNFQTLHEGIFATQVDVGEGVQIVNWCSQHGNTCDTI